MAANESIRLPVSWQNYPSLLSNGSCNNSAIAFMNVQDYPCELAKLCECPNLQANPDIAGTGVVASFILTAALTVTAAAAFTLVRRYDPEHVPRNEVDKWVHQKIALKLHDRYRRRHSLDAPEFQPVPGKQPHVYQHTKQRSPGWWQQCLKSIVIGLSDQQLVTGLSILITACFLYTQGRIEVYHFQIIMDLAWFSVNTHTWSLLLTFEYFGEHDYTTGGREAAHQRHFRGFRALQGLTIWRLLCIYATVALLLWGNIRISFRDLYGWASCPMQCVPLNQPGGQPLRWSIVDGFFIGWEYVIMMPYAFLSDRNRERVEKKLSWIPRMLGMIWPLLSSIAFQVVTQLAWFGIGCWGIATDLQWGRDWMYKAEQQREQEWGFGQVVPLILVMLPFMAAVEVYVDTLRSKETTSDPHEVELDEVGSTEEN